MTDLSGLLRMMFTVVLQGLVFRPREELQFTNEIAESDPVC